MVQNGVHALIRTLPAANGNYGGVLQAFALQEAIRPLVETVDTDLSTPPTARACLKQALIPLKQRLISKPSTRVEMHLSINQYILQFALSRMSTTHLYRFRPEARQSVIDRYNLFVTGSDQVWRSEYGNVPTYLFDFLADRTDVRRIAYAASFGVDDPQFSDDLIAFTGRLARQLDAVSVREASGVRICSDLWQVRAEHLVDPTMLLPRQSYDVLIDSDPHPKAPVTPGRDLCLYFLDPNSDKAAFAGGLSTSIKAAPHSICVPMPRSVREFRLEPMSYTKPTVESWLRAIRDARLVVTDSFHGCVFSIIFNTPFLVVENPQRGQTRIESLLHAFGLQERFVSLGSASAWGEQQIRQLALRRIDWKRVTETLDVHRERGLSFLRRNVSVAPPQQSSGDQ